MTTFMLGQNPASGWYNPSNLAQFISESSGLCFCSLCCFLVRCGMLPDDSFIVKLLYIYPFYPDSIVFSRTSGSKRV
jgi:hypothetical protein